MIVPNICDDGCAKGTGRIHAGSGVFDGGQVSNGDGQPNSQRSDIFRICIMAKHRALRISKFLE